MTADDATIRPPGGDTAHDREEAGQLRDRLREMWGGVAPAWGEHADYIDDEARALTRTMLDATGPAAGERVLELACGPGGLGLAAAERVTPTGEAVLSDVAAGMTAIARRRAAARGLTNVATRDLDLERIDEPDAAFDVVLCREGLMFAVDPAGACREIRRVLRPGGRVTVSVWGPREHNPWLGLVLDAVAEELGRPVPPPGVPGPFALSDSDRLTGLLADAGLDEVTVERVELVRKVASPEEWWRRTSSLAGPLAKILESLPATVRDAVAARAQEAARAHETANGALQFPAVALLASGRRPS